MRRRVSTFALTLVLSSVAWTMSTAATSNRNPPSLSVSGQKLSWTKVGSISSYVLATIPPAPGATKYRTVTGYTVTPSPVPGVTIRYGVRANVTGSAWSTQVSIDYPALPPPGGSGLRVGLAGDFTNDSSNVMQARDVNARLVRKEFRSTGPTLWTDEFFRAATLAGITVLPLVNEPQVPVAYGTYAEHFKALVDRYAPGGTFWSANPSLDAAFAPNVWEILNEPYMGGSGPYNPGLYAGIVRYVSSIVRPTHPGIKLTIAAATTYEGGAVGNGREWIDAMYAAIPTLNDYFDVVAVHPYGHNPDTCDPAARWCFRQVEAIRAKFVAHGATDKRVWITEVGNNVGGGSAETESNQAAFLGRYVDYSVAYGYVDALLYYGYRDYCGDPANKECWFGVLRFDGTQRPAYAKLRDMAALYP